MSEKGMNAGGTGRIDHLQKSKIKRKGRIILKMTKVTLGKTGICVEKNAFGALPVQRVSRKDAVSLLRRAYEHGVDFFDTARYYTDMEEKLGESFEGVR